jgi:hypothetical protein
MTYVQRHHAAGIALVHASKLFVRTIPWTTSCALLVYFALQGEVDAAGMRCFDNLPVSAAVRSGQGDKLIDAGYIDVTKRSARRAAEPQTSVEREGEGGTSIGEHYMFRIEGTTRPLAIYQPSIEGAKNDLQVVIKNSKNVTWYGFKFENTGGDHELLHIVDSDNIGILGGSGNYASGKPFITVKGSNNVTVTSLARKGQIRGSNIMENGVQRVGATKKITTYKKGDAKLFGELNPPDFPYPRSPR